MKQFRILVVAATLSLCCAWSSAAQAVHRPDSWITTKVKIAFMTSSDVSAREVNVDTIEGKVALHGTVETQKEKDRAEQIAKGIDGVHSVRNLIAVVPAREQKAVEAKDEDIKKAISSAFEADPTLRDSKISVQSVNGGVVLLAGEAKNMSEQLLAVQRAVSVPGVRRVATEMTGPEVLSDREIWHGNRSAAETDFKPAGDAPEARHGDSKSIGTSASDMWITTATKARLIANSKTPAMDINVDTRDGVVTLFGMVPTQEAKTEAGNEAQKVSGVRNVRNELQVVASAKQELVKRTDDEIRKDVEARLKNLPGSDVKVEVTNAVVRLSGTVDNSANYLQAMTVARSTKGVQAVISENLQVQ